MFNQILYNITYHNNSNVCKEEIFFKKTNFHLPSFYIICNFSPDNETYSEM